MTEPLSSEKTAWVRRLVEQHQSPLIRYAQSIVLDEHIARDLVQETFLRLCRQSPSDLAEREAAWLFRVCHNLAINRHRKERRMKVVETIGESTGAESDPADGMVAEEENVQLEFLIEQLPEDQQKVIRLKFNSGLKYREISEATGLSVSNVGFLLHTAIGTLRSKLQFLGGASP